MLSKKYARSLHVPFSPGTTSDDRLQTWEQFREFLNTELIITEKLDGSNVCLTRTNVFARSHSGPPDHPSFLPLMRFHKILKERIPDGLSIFGEWAFAVHSIKYRMMIHPLNIFGVRDDKTGVWWDWDDVVMMASELDLITVPMLLRGSFHDEKLLISIIEEFASYSSVYGPIREGLVLRKACDISQPNECFGGLAKWVRKDHVCGEHWKKGSYIKQPNLSFL